MFRVHARRAVLAAGVVAVAAGVPLSQALAGPPAGGEDITGKTVYLAPNAALRYGKSLLSRVYTRSASSLELKGTGSCTTFNCPVLHNGVALFARRVRLDIVRPTGPVLSDRTLRRGDDGTDVRALQELLVAKGYAVTVDGKFSSGTEDAVMVFQRREGLKVDGVVGPQVRERLAASTGTAAKVDKITDKIGAVKDAVKDKIQDKVGDIKSKPKAVIAAIKVDRILRQGDEGEDVRLIQEVLVAKGYKIKVDGKYGSGTRAAVRDFQRGVGLSPDGNVGPDTLAKLVKS